MKLSLKHYASGALLALAVASPVWATDDCKFLKKIPLPSQQTAVVASGDLEACSLGSYSVRVYSTRDAQLGDDTTFFSFGLLQGREGTIEDAFTADLGKRAPHALIVTTRSAGSGGYIDADAFAIDRRGIRPITAIRGRDKHTNIVAVLKQALAKKTGSDPQGAE